MNAQAVRRVAFGDKRDNGFQGAATRSCLVKYKWARCIRKTRAKKWQLRAMARQGGNLHHEKPPERCDTRRNSYETGARGSQRVIV